MNCPSIHNLMNSLHLTRKQAQEVRAVMRGFDAYRTKLERIDEIIHTHGVEYIPPGHNAKSPAIQYCNSGDPYRATVMLVNGRFSVGSWGDIVERGKYD